MPNIASNLQYFLLLKFFSFMKVIRFIVPRFVQNTLRSFQINQLFHEGVYL